MQRDTFKKLLQLKLARSILIDNMGDEVSVSKEVVLCKLNNQIESLEKYLRNELDKL